MRRESSWRRARLSDAFKPGYANPTSVSCRRRRNGHPAERPRVCDDTRVAAPAEDLEQARAYVGRVLMSLRGELDKIQDAKAASELQDALSVLDSVGYRVEGRSPRRASLATVEVELDAAAAGLSSVEIRFDRDVLGSAGAHIE